MEDVTESLSYQLSQTEKIQQDFNMNRITQQFDERVRSCLKLIQDQLIDVKASNKLEPNIKEKKIDCLTAIKEYLISGSKENIALEDGNMIG